MEPASRNLVNKTDTLTRIASWLVEQGLKNATPEDMLEGYCTRLVQAGIPISRVQVVHRAIHPEYGGVAFIWNRDQRIERRQFERRLTPNEGWLTSPFHRLVEQESSELRERLAELDKPSQFPFLNELRARGTTDYLAARLLFDQKINPKNLNPNRPPEGLMISWASKAASGFSETDIAALRGLQSSLGLALKSISERQTGKDLLRVYLGRDVGRRVLSGEINRGSFETIEAVIFYFDLQGFTKLSESISGASVIEMLNDYYDPVVSVIEDHGGNVLKFMGDGLIAIFSLDELEDANSAAIQAAAKLRAVIAKVNQRRKSDGLPSTGFNIGLHSGDVHYGNIGSASRLDFTVIGPAVNTTARILGMCNPLEENVIMSSHVAGPAFEKRSDLVSLGPYKLRGVSAPRELFALLEADQTPV